MAATIVDIHPHIVSTDTKRYPPTPLFGIQSDWSKESPANPEDLIAAMDDAGVHKTAIVHASTVYGFNNALVAEAVKLYPKRCSAVGSIDMLAPDAAATAKRWLDLGLEGFRIFTGGSTKKVDASSLDDPRSYPVWQIMNERGLSMCIQTDTSGLAATASLAKRFPKVPILIDHFARADVTGGPPYDNARPLLDLAKLPNLYLKYTAPGILALNKAKADVAAFTAKIVAEFGADRIAWGSNWPNSPGTMKAILAEAKQAVSGLAQRDQDMILGGTALKVYPSLKG